MNEYKMNEAGMPTPPPMVKKPEDKKPQGSGKFNKKLLIIIPIIIAIAVGAVIAAVLLKDSKDKTDEATTNPAPIVVTDSNGVTVTDAQGEPVTVIPETTVEKYTDEKGEVHTTIVYKEVTVPVVVTDKEGETVTEKDGEVVTEIHTMVPTPPTTNVPSKPNVIGTTIIAVTDGQGNTTPDEQGNILTTIAEITEAPPVVVEPAKYDWKDSQGGTAADYFSSVEPLADGGYISAVVTNSKDGSYTDFAEYKYAVPFTVLTKYKEDGKIDWQTVVGSRKGLVALQSLVPTADGGFYAIGYGKNVGGVNGKGYYDGAVFKFDKDGNEQWHQVFGTTTVDLFNDATLTSDGGVVVVGSVGTNDKDAAGFGKPALESAACVVKYAADGTLLWKDIVGGNQDSFTGVAEVTDGSILCLGNFYSNEVFKKLGGTDSAVLKYSANGEYQHYASISGTGNEQFSGITACKNGGVLVVGKSNSSDAGATESIFVGDLSSRGGYDAYIIKLDNDLTITFAKPFRGQNDDVFTDVVEKEDGSFIVTGHSNSSSRDFKGITTRGGDDIIIVCFDKYGTFSWKRSFGGSKDDSANAICLAHDGGYIVAGKTLSKDIDMKGIAQYVNGKAVGVIIKFPE